MFLPFLGFSIIVVVIPEFRHHLVLVNTEFLGVDSGKLGQGEGPSVVSGSEGNSGANWANLQFSHGCFLDFFLFFLLLFFTIISIGSLLVFEGSSFSVLSGFLVSIDDNVDTLNYSCELLVHIFSFGLEFEDTSVNLVDHEHWLDPLSEGLSEDSLGLDTDTFDVIDDNEGTVSYSEGRSYFRTEIDVSRRVDQVDQESFFVLCLVKSGWVSLVVQ
mmetsp:Transcript_21291/g.20940  ORF Transcript_21291/g.20940 Transcript_21291/m.20940 type:complete len:216 (-) Transcript_21291:249-896(-)